MAYKDSSGRITIDEHAAQQDIQKINQAKSALENSKKALENIINQASNEQGQTAIAIVEKATELKNQINTMIGRLNETSSFISNTIAHYQEVDRLVKEAIQNSMRAAAAATSNVCFPKSFFVSDNIKIRILINFLFIQFNTTVIMTDVLRCIGSMGQKDVFVSIFLR